MLKQLFIAALLVWIPPAAGALDLLERYPTPLVNGDLKMPRPSVFTRSDVFHLSNFHFSVEPDLAIEIGPAELGVGHCEDGAVWAVIIPKDTGTLVSKAAANKEAISHLWLRFHPREVTRLFPPAAVSSDSNTDVYALMWAIANHKIGSSFQGNGKPLIPEPKDMTVDADTKNGPRRFFGVDVQARSVKYIPAFEQLFLPPALPASAATLEAAFDQLWHEFDERYPMFILRPEVDWAKVRNEFRPVALNSKSAYEFALVCADMLQPLRDLHISLKVGQASLPVFDRPHQGNANPAAHRRLLKPVFAQLDQRSAVQWAITRDKIGYLAIYRWDRPDILGSCEEALEQMRATRGLIVDVRLNGGGNESIARGLAGRFLAKEFIYAYSRFRNGSQHTNLTAKIARVAIPRGPWRYDRPVVLLIGQKCMSSNESFISMMTGASNVTTMGERTCGSSGNPKPVSLPLDITVTLPQWIDYLPNGLPLDERGIEPQIQFRPTPGAFEGDRDDLLKAALERLQQLPLPAQPMSSRFRCD